MCQWRTRVDKLRYMQVTLLFMSYFCQHVCLPTRCQIKIYGYLRIQIQPPLLRSQHKQRQRFKILSIFHFQHTCSYLYAITTVVIPKYQRAGKKYGSHKNSKKQTEIFNNITVDIPFNNKNIHFPNTNIFTTKIIVG